MPFTLRLERAAPPVSSDDPHAVALAFLRKVGVVGEGYDPLSADGQGPEGSAPVSVLVDCFMAEPDRSWSAAEISKQTKHPLGQVYRALWKMQGLDWLTDSGRPGKVALAGRRYRLRFGSLTQAWSFTELAAGHCLSSYAAMAKAIEEKMAPARAKGAAKPAPKESKPAADRAEFVMRLSDEVNLPTQNAREMGASFLEALGVIPERTGGRKPQQLPSFRVFFNAFLVGGERWQGFEELAASAGATRPTLLKHLRRLEGLDLIERTAFDDEYGFPRRHWRLRHGSLTRAFEFTDARARLALDSMARWAEHLESLTRDGKLGAKKARAPRTR